MDNADIVVELLRQGCDVNMVSSSGEAALHYAVRSGQPYIAKLILDATAGTGVNATTFNVSLLYMSLNCPSPSWRCSVAQWKNVGL